MKVYSPQEPTREERMNPGLDGHRETQWPAGHFPIYHWACLQPSLCKSAFPSLATVQGQASSALSQHPTRRCKATSEGLLGTRRKGGEQYFTSSLKIYSKTFWKNVPLTLCNRTDESYSHFLSSQQHPEEDVTSLREDWGPPREDEDPILGQCPMCKRSIPPSPDTTQELTATRPQHCFPLFYQLSLCAYLASTQGFEN